MRRGNPPYGGHDKVTRKLATIKLGDVVETYHSNVIGTYRRRLRDVLTWCREYVSLRRLGKLPLRRRWMIHLTLVWDLVETYWRGVIFVPFWGHRDLSLRPLENIPPRCCWVFYLRLICHVVVTCRKKSLRRCHVLMPRGDKSRLLLLCAIHFVNQQSK